ncbi:hypothetical protein [Microbacterium oxydans]|uniref:hypothetical protein n=1 Tax=Microbacterium oxydans TaxID=82380 RepID=UPI00112174BA|nr:hypothetical protein [Microbacterium oxydans]
MRLAQIGAVSVLALMVLTGCTAPASTDTADTQASQAPSPSPTPTIDPGPVELSTAEAGERYLGIVCQRNGATERMNQAFIAGEEEYLNGGNPDVAAVKAAAAEVLRLNTMQIALLDDPYFTWPDGLDAHLSNVRDASMTQASTFNALVNAATFEDAYNQPVSDDPEGAKSSQEIRYQLQLSPDTTASCQGYETSAEALHAEMVERNEYLASFGEQE